MFSLEPIVLSDEFPIQNPKSEIQNASDPAERAGASGQSNQVIGETDKHDE